MSISPYVDKFVAERRTTRQAQREAAERQATRIQAATSHMRLPYLRHRSGLIPRLLRWWGGDGAVERVLDHRAPVVRVEVTALGHAVVVLDRPLTYFDHAQVGGSVVVWPKSSEYDRSDEDIDVYVATQIAKAVTDFDDALRHSGLTPPTDRTHP